MNKKESKEKSPCQCDIDPKLNELDPDLDLTFLDALDPKPIPT
jgi:hypothetical protein